MVADKMKELSEVREIWLRDLCNLRGNVAHGKIGEAYKPIWSIRNHLLLASYAFPLVLKSFLATKGVYTLTPEDQFDIDVFEQLACEEHFSDLPEDRSHPWNIMRVNAWREQQLAELAASMTQTSAPEPEPPATT